MLVAGKPIPVRYTHDGDNVSPPLAWRDLPPQTQELALVVDDPDTPRPFVHWLLYKIDPARHGLPEGVPQRAQTEVGMQGINSARNVGYDGPAPPRGVGPHHYRFHLYALDTPLQLRGKVDKERLLAAMVGHVVAEGELISLYGRP